MTALLTNQDQWTFSQEARRTMAMDNAQTSFRRMRAAICCLSPEDQTQLKLLARQRFSQLKGNGWLPGDEASELKWETMAETAVRWAEDRYQFLSSAVHRESLWQLATRANDYLKHRSEYLELGGPLGIAFE